MTQTRRRLLGSRIAVLAALALAIAVVVAVVLVTRSPSPARSANNASTSASATTVQRRNLVQTDTEAGTLSYASPHTVYNRLSGTVTWLPAVGQVVQPGGTLYAVDGRPVVLMNGTTPAYRALRPSDSAGPDVLELNRNLIALGFNPDGIVASDEWQSATTAGVEQFQASIGVSETGTLSLGRVVFLPGAQLVGSRDVVAGSAQQAALRRPVSQPEFVSLTTSATTNAATSTPTTTTPPATPPHTGHTPTGKHRAAGGGPPSTLAALVALLKAEIAQLKAERGSPGNGGNSPSNGSTGNNPQSSATGGTGGNGGNGSNGGNGGNGGTNGNGANNGGNGGGNGGSGGGGGAGAGATAVLETTSTKLVVTVDLDASKQSEAHVGEKVSVELPNGNTVDGTVSAVSPVAQSSSGDNGSGGNGSGVNGSGGNGSGGNGNGGNSSGSAVIPVTVSLSGRHTGHGLDQSSVSVDFIDAVANNVLSVPVTALLATPGGGYAVQAASAPHRLIPVTAGLFAAGYVAISGPGVYPGLSVTDSQG